MQLKVFIDGVDVSSFALIDSTEIIQEISGRVATARIRFLIQGASTRYDVAEYDESEYANLIAGLVNSLAEVVIENEDEDRIFGGYITKVSYDRITPQTLFLDVDCTSYGLTLETTIVNQSFTSSTDRAIIQAVMSGTGITATNGNVSLLQSISSYEAKDISVRQVLDDICALTGAEWFVDFDKNLKYRTATSEAAPFGFSDSSSSFNWMLDRYSTDFTNPANRVTVIGGLGTGGTNLSATVNDTASQALYGVQAVTIVDRNIRDSPLLTLRGNVELSQRAFPEISGTIRYYQDGLAIGQAVNIVSSSHGINGDFAIRKLTMRQKATDATEYILEFGAYRPDLSSMLASLNRAAKESATTPQGIPPENSVTGGSGGMIQGDTITGSNLVNATITGTKIANATITGTNIASATIVGSNIQNASITGTQIASATITGGNIATATVTGSNIASGSILSGNIGSGTITGGNIASSTITGGNLASGTITASNIQNLTITAAQIDNLTINGTKIADNAITNSKVTAGTLTGDRLTNGTITAAQIANATITGTQIAAATIAGSNIATATIAGSNIVNATITGGIIASATITGSNIASATITGSNIQSATITGSNIASGTITGSNIQSASITGSQIGSATITGTNIGSLTIQSTNIADLAITNVKISSLDVSKLTAGTISAAVSMTSPTITSTGSGVGTITLSNGVVSSAYSGFTARLGAGFVYCQDSGSGLAQMSSNGGLYYRNPSSQVVFEANQSNVTLNKPLVMGFTTVLDTSRNLTNIGTISSTGLLNVTSGNVNISSGNTFSVGGSFFGIDRTGGLTVNTPSGTVTLFFKAGILYAQT